MAHGRYRVERVGDQAGPAKTITVAEYMKPWNSQRSFGSNDNAGWPNVGIVTRSGNAIRQIKE